MMRDLLKSTFGDCKFALSSLCGSKSSYENISDETFFIFDPPTEENQPIRIVKREQDHQLKINNPNKTEVCIVKTDKCLFTDELAKCDCFLFDEKKFYLVEIKSSGIKKRSAQRQRAMEQLESTLKVLLQYGITFDGFDAWAMICFKFEKEHLIRTSNSLQKDIFFEDYGVNLGEGNKIEF